MRGADLSRHGADVEAARARRAEHLQREVTDGMARSLAREQQRVVDLADLATLFALDITDSDRRYYGEWQKWLDTTPGACLGGLQREKLRRKLAAMRMRAAGVPDDPAKLGRMKSRPNTTRKQRQQIAPFLADPMSIEGAAMLPKRPPGRSGT
jgi:hypothetical protein